MYRLDRVGPWPLSTIESAPRLISPALIEAAMGPIKDHHYYLDDVTNGPDKKGENFWLDTLSIPSAEGIAVGVTIDGSQWHEAVDGEYLLAYAGAIAAGSAEPDVNIIPLLGRVDSNIGLNGLLPQWAYVPPSNGTRSDGATAVGHNSANGQVVLGDWKPEGTLELNNIFFGWFFTNHGAGPALISNIGFSVSVHRYLEDLRPFDPNR